MGGGTISTATSCSGAGRRILLVRPSLVYATSRSSLVNRPFLSSYESQHLETDVVSQRDDVANVSAISQHNNMQPTRRERITRPFPEVPD